MDFTAPSSRTQLATIERLAGQSLSALKAEAVSLAASHSAKRAHFMQAYGLSHVHADTLVLWTAEPDVAPDAGLATDALYAGARAELRPLHDALVALVDGFGAAYEIAPKKGYLSLRRRKQFMMITPMAREIALGLNARDLAVEPPLKALPPGKLCQYELRLATPEAIDARLVRWVETAFSAAA